MFPMLRALEQRRFAAASAWLYAAILGGLAYIGDAMHGYSAQTFGMSSSAYGSIYVTMTGFHLLHVVAGVSGGRPRRRRSGQLLLAFRDDHVVRDLLDSVLDPMNVRDRAIAASLVLSMVGSIGFMYGFWRQLGAQWQGLALACVFAGLMLATLGWARWILPHEQVVDLRDTYPQPEHERGMQVEAFTHGIAQTTRKTWLTRMLYSALGVFGIAAIFPVGALGPEPGDTLFHTRWKAGNRLQRDDGTFVKAADMNEDSVVTVFPEGSVGDYRSMTVLIRLPDGVGENTANGLIAYSKACTHAGCPVALYRAADHRLICPCHQSVFDAADGAKVLDGPADRPLPQLPIAISQDGYVRATGDFADAIGPGFWEHS